MSAPPSGSVRFATFARDPVQWLALGGGSGLSPIAPGTMGTLAAFPLHWLLLLLPSVWHGLLVLAACVLGVWICGEASRRLGGHDHPAIVWDEIAAFLLLLYVLPQGLAWWLAAFVLFRFFDVLKPWPIRTVDRSVRGGAGIMIDDLLAALYAWLVLQLPLLLFV